MFSKRDLKNHLQEISEDAVFVKFQFFSTDKFSIQLKCKAPPEQASEHSAYVGEWIKKFSAFTATTWIVRNSFPNRKRMVFRKVFACHRSSFNKKTKPNPDRTRNQGCRAKIDFRVKFINKNTIKNDPHLKQGLNLSISIDFTHSHKLWTAESFNLLKSTSETDEIFYSYLNNGYSPTAAKLYHELSLIDRYGDNPECLMNANINPTVRHVHYLHKKFKQNNEENPSFEDIMATKRANVENTGGFINYDNPEVIIVVTPTMRRVISTTCLDHILVDSALINGPVVTFLYVPSKAGALPVACVLHAEQNETSYTQAFLAVKLTLDNICNGFEPKLITIKESKEIRDATNAIFPSSNVFTSKWSLCSEVWQWTFGEDVKIESKKRHGIMELFDKLIRANTLDEAEIYYAELKEDESVKSVAIANDYVNELWGKREQWLYRDEHSYMRLVEASIRILEEFIHRKCKSFNVYVMIDVVTNIIENQIRHVLCAHANNANIAETYTRFLCKPTTAAENNADWKEIAPKEYKIESGDKPRKYIRFRVDTWCCDCAAGKKARFCEHLCAVINTIDTELMKPCELTDEEKCLLTEIAGGDVELAKMIKSELSDSKMDLEESDKDDADNEYCEEIDNGLDDDEEEKQSVASPKSETNEDDGFYYLDIKTENSVGVDPLEESSVNDVEGKSELSNLGVYEMPSTSGASKPDLKRKYEDAMRNLNNEFRRLNKYFKQNPNKGNMETMVRLARELGKIRPIERVDLSNMQITLNDRGNETDS